MQAVAYAPEPEAKPKRKIPESLVYEIMDGQPVYRRGYRSVLNKTKTLDDIMGSSTLQSELHLYLFSLLIRHFDDRKFAIYANEAGLHLSKHNNLAGDIFVYDRRAMTPENINKFYSTVPPLLAFEIDVKAELEKESDIRYIHRKTKKLLDFGVQKVFWVITDAQKVIMAEAGNAAILLMDWSENIEIQPGLSFNIGQYLASKGIHP
ncbi:MAG: Uma2 family endonuclease [Saprospiraceae bacterium]